MTKWHGGGFRQVKVTAEQWVSIKEAIEIVQATEGCEMSRGRALELICSDFLSGAQYRLSNGYTSIPSGHDEKEST